MEDRACYDNFFECLDELSTAAGYVIAMGQKYLNEHDVVADFEAKMSVICSATPLLHRMQLAYATLIYFTALVSTGAATLIHVYCSEHIATEGC